MQDEGLLTEIQAAEYLKLTPRALQDWRSRGVGPPYLRVSPKCIRYRAADIEGWLGKCRIESGRSWRHRSGQVVQETERRQS